MTAPICFARNDLPIELWHLVVAPGLPKNGGNGSFEDLFQASVHYCTRPPVVSAELVNNQRELMWRFRCTRATRLRDGPAESRRAEIMSDLMMLQRVAERTFPPASRAEDPEKWHKVALFGCISSICPPV
jgi:hypothetical protein